MLNYIKFFQTQLISPVAVIGDLILDSYITGSVTRISPEAPIPVFQVGEEYHLAGGAGNVGLNLVSLGVPVHLIGRVGDDLGGDELISQLQSKGINTDLVQRCQNYPTSVKKRIIASGQQLLRLDKEQIISYEGYRELLPALDLLLAKVSLLAISDYQKGMLTPNLLQELFKIAKKHNLKTIVDPKGADFSKYRGATIIKPNRHEAYLAAGLPRTASLEMVASKLLEITQAEYLLITLSEEGTALFAADGSQLRFPAVVREVRDVTGAGDTVLAAVVSSLVRGLTLGEAIEVANIAAGIVIEKVGCAQVTLPLLARALTRRHTASKIFTPTTKLILAHALLPRQIVLLHIRGLPNLTAELYRAIQSIKSHHPQYELLIHFTPENLQADLSPLLAALGEVDWVYASIEEIEELVEEFQPLFTWSYHPLHGLVPLPQSATVAVLS